MMTSINSVANGSQGEVFDGIERLAPYDGMFLRSGHLTTIEDYARDLNSAAARATGGGVAYGYSISLVAGDPQLLHVDAGLVVTAAGSVLELESGRDRPLPKVNAGDTRAWVVQAVPGERPDGDPELVYGQLCDDGNDNQGPQRPLIAEGVSIGYIELSLAELAGVQVGSVHAMRSQLARILFRLEDDNQSRLSTDLSTVPWSTGSSATTPPRWIPPRDPRLDGSADAVPLGVLVRVNDEWHIDPWLVRRDLMESAPERGWQWRLGMRPRNVFLAQILQFQSQLDEIAELTTKAAAATRQSRGISGAAADEMATAVRKANLDREVKERVLELFEELKREGASEPPQDSLPGRGFVELPPAGFLPLPDALGKGGVRAYVETLLGDAISPRFHACEQAAVFDFLSSAQHLGRIPLNISAGASATSVDVLVPGQWDTEASETPGNIRPDTRWVAFARHGRVEAEPQESSTLRVYATTMTKEEYGNLPSPPADPPVTPESEHVGELRYAAGSFAAVDATVFGAVQSRLQNADEATILVIVRDASQIPITALRAALLVAPFNDRPLHIRLWSGGDEPPKVRIVAPEPAA